MQVLSLSRVFAICQLSDSCCRKNISIMNDDIEMETVTENDKPFIFLNSLMLLSANSRHAGGHFFQNVLRISVSALSSWKRDLAWAVITKLMPNWISCLSDQTNRQNCRNYMWGNPIYT